MSKAKLTKCLELRKLELKLQLLTASNVFPIIKIRSKPFKTLKTSVFNISNLEEYKGGSAVQNSVAKHIVCEFISIYLDLFFWASLVLQGFN